METTDQKIFNQNKIKNNYTTMKSKKSTNKSDVEMSFNSKSLEREKGERLSITTSIEDQEKLKKEFDKEYDKVHKFESFIKSGDFSDSLLDDSDEVSGCGCCQDCTGTSECDCGCENCKCDELEDQKDTDVNLIGDFMSNPISENLKYHLKNSLPITENIFRPGSKAFFDVIKEARVLFDRGVINLCDIDKELYESTDIGRFGYFNGELVPLDLPMENIFELNESEYKGKKVKLNYPMRSSGPKKYKVYVKNPKTGKVKVVHFGDVKGGLTAKINDPVARKSFIARHNCRRKWKPSDKLSAAYWSCRLPRYKNIFSGSYSGYW